MQTTELHQKCRIVSVVRKSINLILICLFLNGFMSVVLPVHAETPFGFLRKPIITTGTGPVGPGAFLINGITGGSDVTVDANLDDGVDPTIHWGSSTGATSYDITIKDSTGSSTLCSTTGATGTSAAVSSCNLAIGGNYKAYVTASDGANTTNANNEPFSFSIPNSGPKSLSTPTTSISYIVPTGVTSITVKMWGGAGGSGNSARGGAGGYATGIISVTPGETLTIKVASGGYGAGSGGSAGVGGTNGGGTSTGSNASNGGGGGGYSSVQRGATYLIVAGGGGGSAYLTSAGGAGGGLTGVAGTSGNTNGGGAGGQASGGAGSNGAGGGSQSGNTGAAYTGGDAGKGGGGSGEGGGAGGGGYYGGGGAGGATSANSPPGGGGGGSSYAAVGVSSVTLTAGTGPTPANTGDAYYQAGTAVAPTVGSGVVQAGNGLVVLIP